MLSFWPYLLVGDLDACFGDIFLSKTLTRSSFWNSCSWPFHGICVRFYFLGFVDYMFVVMLFFALPSYVVFVVGFLGKSTTGGTPKEEKTWRIMVSVTCSPKHQGMFWYPKALSDLNGHLCAQSCECLLDVSWWF